MSSAEAAFQKMIVLKSSDGETFELEEAFARESQAIMLQIGDNCAETGFPLPNITSKTLTKVVEYCKRHGAAAKASGDGSSAGKVVDGDLEKFDAEFVKVDKGSLFDLISAADSLGIKSLRSLACQAVADMMKGMSPEEIQDFLRVV